jgi:outer membrane protein TolC
MRRYILIASGLLACLGILVLPSGAEQGSGASLRLTLAEAVDSARRASARLGQLRSLEAASEAGARGARAARLPQVDLGASYTRNSDVPELTIVSPGAGTRTLFPNIPDNLRVRAGLSLPLYTGGRIGGAIDAAQSMQLASAKDVLGGDADLVLEARTAYWSLVTARESARVLGEAVTSFEAHLKDAGNRAEQGMAARNEVLAVQVERDRAELSRLQAQNAAEVAQANLLRLLDLPASTRIEPVEPLVPPPTPQPDATALAADALALRPELAGLRGRVSAAEASVKVARAAYLPQASLTAGYDYARPNTRILPLVAEWKGTWSVSLNVALTAFDGGRTSAAVAQAQAQADAARQQLQDLERRVRLDVTVRALDLVTAQAALAVAERSLEAARENLRVSQDRYREGVIPSSDLLDAETALLRAGLDRTASVSQLQVARASLERAVGR